MQRSVLHMFLPAHATRVVVYLHPFNVRWGSAKVRTFCVETLGIKPDGSTAFLFTNRARDCLLLYALDPADGDQLLLKKLDKGAFLLPAPCKEGEPFVIMRPKMLPNLFRT